MIAANETESKWWICDCCCRFITLRRHASNILYLWKSAQWQMIKVHKKCRIDDILIEENLFFFFTELLLMFQLMDRVRNGVDPMIANLESYIVTTGLDDMKACADTITSVRECILYLIWLSLQPRITPPPTSIGNSQLACISKFTVRHIFMFCYYLLFCCKINLVLAENDANLINNTLNEHSVPRLKIW